MSVPNWVLPFENTRPPSSLQWKLIFQLQITHKNTRLNVWSPGNSFHEIGDQHISLCTQGSVSLTAHDLIIKINYFAFYLNQNTSKLYKPQFGTCHNSPAVVTCAKLWLTQMSIFQIKSKENFIKFTFWTLKWLVKSAPHPPSSSGCWHPKEMIRLSQQCPREWDGQK